MTYLPQVGVEWGRGGDLDFKGVERGEGVKVVDLTSGFSNGVGS